jgi:hypothetical protein
MFSAVLDHIGSIGDDWRVHVGPIRKSNGKRHRKLLKGKIIIGYLKMKWTVAKLLKKLILFDKFKIDQKTIY